MSKIILAFDTAMSACGAALYNADNHQLLSVKQEPMQRGQAERLVPLIDELLTDAGITYKDLGIIACTNGPGAFTGLRLSLATARTFSLSLNIPAIGVSTLEVISHQVSSDQNLMVCLETKRKDYYTQVFDKDKNVLEPPNCKNLSQVTKAIQKYQPLVTGDANERLASELQIACPQMTDIPYPDCSVLAKLAFEKFEENGDRLQNMEPLYLRDADVSFPATKK